MKRYRQILYLVEGELVEDGALRRVLQLAAAFDGRLTIARLVAGEDDGTATSTTDLPASIARSGVPVEVRRLPAVIEEIVSTVRREDHDLVAKKASPDASLASYLFGTLDTALIERAPAPVLIEKPTPHERFQRILAAVDLTDEGAHEALILEHAVSLARVEKASVLALHVWHLEGEEGMRGRAFTRRARQAIDELKAKETRDRRARLEALVDPFRTYGVPIEPLVIEGPPALSIVETAEARGVDLTVIGTHVTSHLEGLALGSTTEAVLRRIRCALLSVKPFGFRAD